MSERHESDRYRPIESLELEMRDRLAAKDAEISRLKAENARLTEWADLMVDEFRRIRACPGVSEEVKGLCDRAVKEARYRIPMIQLFEERGEKVKDLECNVLNLNAALARVRGQRDNLANDLHDEYAKRHAREMAPTTREKSAAFADWQLREAHSLRILDGVRTVEEIGS